ncbi:response regulator, partial [Rhodobaculum claviforme]
SAGAEPLVLACFIDTPRAAPADPAAPAGSTAPGDRRVGDMEADLEATRSDLFDALRDLEQEVEAHRTDAAEALSINEEFQSTNEELLASKEELQSLNEELTALNSQLQETLERHRTTANDLQNVLFSTDVATLFLDLDLNIRFFTPSARAVFRVIPSDVGRPLGDLAAVLADPGLMADARTTLAERSTSEREIGGADGVWFLRRIQPYRAEGGVVEGVVITYLDISERKRINAALRAATNEAQRATRAKSRFLAAASHDLRQPLQSMALLHRLLAGQKSTTEGVRLASLMDQTLMAMAEMLDSMLEANRIESGIVRASMQPVALAPLMRRIADEYAPQCALKGLKLRCVPSDGHVHSDPRLLEQILRNLMSNALKYTPTGGILLGCRRRGGDLVMVVCDTGVGVSASEAEAIFDAYRQGDNAATLAAPGLGLGLSIVQRLARLMGHRVTVRSVPGKGSAFMVTLPRLSAARHAPGPHATSVAAEGTAAAAPDTPRPAHARRPTGTILLVEDETPLRDLLAEVLVAEGHEVIARPDARSALAWVDRAGTRPNVLLTDFDLHGAINGLGLAQKLADRLGTAVPSIILTGDITAGTRRAIARTACHQIAKPVRPEVLLALIGEMMEQGRRSLPKPTPRPGGAGITIHVVDDDPLIRKTMRHLFEAEDWCVVTHASAEDFLAAPRTEGDACLLVDNLLPGMDGVALIARLRTERSRLPAVMLTGHGDASTAVAAMKAGASDLIEKPASAAELLASMRRAIATRDTGPARTDARDTAQARFSALTTRERQVLARVLQGAPNKIIAADLGINQRTVENHRASVMRKTGATSLPELVRLALAADAADG